MAATSILKVFNLKNDYFFINNSTDELITNTKNLAEYVLVEEIEGSTARYLKKNN